MEESVRHFAPFIILIAAIALVFVSNAHWGYNPAFIDTRREELTPADAAAYSPHIRLMEIGGRPPV